MLYYLIFNIILWSLFAWYNYTFIRYKEYHIVGAIISIFIALGIPFLYYYSNLKILGYDEICYLAFISLTIRWIWYDILLNLLMKQKWYYIGSTSWLDKYFGGWSLFALKPMCLFFSIIMVISLW